MRTDRGKRRAGAGGSSGEVKGSSQGVGTLPPGERNGSWVVGVFWGLCHVLSGGCDRSKACSVGEMLSRTGRNKESLPWDK